MNLKQMFRRKSVEELTAAANDEEGRKLNKVLTSRDIFNAGVACIIGTGIFVITGVAAHDYAGPGIILSFLQAGIACAFVAFAYAELASMIPVSGSAYTYAYATQGELLAWIIGWDLLLEYPVGSAAVATGWSGYLQSLLGALGIHLPTYLTHAPETVPWLPLAAAAALLGVAVYAGLRARRSFATGASGGGVVAGIAAAVALVLGGKYAFEVLPHITSIDLPAIAIVGALNFFLIKGVKHTARMTGLFVVLKLAVIAIFIALGVWHINTANYTPFLPFGWKGVFAGASIVFFAYIGFDACTTLSEECKEPQRDVPRGVLGSLGVCTILYLAVAAIMTGAMSYTMLVDSSAAGEASAPMAVVLKYIGHSWAVPLVSIGAMAGITSVLIVLLLGQSRIMMRMSRDGLIPPIFGRVHPKYGTPSWSITLTGLATAVMAGLLPIGELIKLTNIGTLAAFVLVCLGVIVLRRVEPNRLRKFRCPGSPWVPLAGAAMSMWLIVELPMLTLMRFGIWMVAGLVVYFLYSASHSLMNKRPAKSNDETGPSNEPAPRDEDPGSK